MSTPRNKQGYLHGFSPEEQERLYQQARFLESKIYETVDFSKAKTLLEIGCGVGAQTEILLERFPSLYIQGVDASPIQLEKAKERLSTQIKEKRVTLTLGDATHLSFPDNSFDGGWSGRRLAKKTCTRSSSGAAGKTFGFTLSMLVCGG